MAKRLQLRGGTTSQHSTFTGALREVTVDTDKDTLVVHDGATAGGFPLAKSTDTELVNDTTPQLGGDLDLNSSDITGTGDINITGSITSNGVNTSSFSSVNVSGELNLNATGTNIIDFAGTDTNIRWLNSSPVFESVFTATRNGEISLKYNGAEKLATTSTGVDITGTLLADKGYIAETTLTDGATISWDMNTQSVAKVTLGGNRTIAAPTNGSTGQFASLLVAQDGTGGRTLTWNAVYEFASDTAPTLTATASLGDLFVFRYNGSKWLEVGRNLALTLS